jgi:transcriptional regulator with XRE-family HTH domain
MIKQFVAKPKQKDLAAAGPRVGAAVWSTVGRRLQRRRAEIGCSVEHVAQWAEIAAETYESYEKGAPIPAALLAEIAELFGVPLVWFFQGVGRDDAGEEEDEDERTAPPVYQVATVEHRIASLVESFRRLDFEGQQHLLALSRELTRTNARAARD